MYKIPNNQWVEYDGFGHQMDKESVQTIPERAKRKSLRNFIYILKCGEKQKMKIAIII